MKFTGVIRKMSADLYLPVQYYWDLGGDIIHINEWIGNEIEIRFIKYQCLSCGKEKKIFHSGYCYDCASNLPQTGDWIIHPELSKAHLDIEDRDLDYEKSVQLQPHYVYLSNTGNVKVGVTRYSQIPDRWIDQGAGQAVIMLETPNRYLAGKAEVLLKKHISDKTNRNMMLTGETVPEDLQEMKNALAKHLTHEFKPYFVNAETVTIKYPVEQYPAKIRPVKLDATGIFNGVLKGVKGQYWIFSGGYVWNVRNHEGYKISVNI